MTSVALAQFAVAASLPAMAATSFYLLERNTGFGRLSYAVRQAVVGIVFGVIAILGTEFGISTEDATMNVRDAAPMVAGLLFGGPSGVVAGVIGGVERWFAALWGRGVFTRLGCSVATVFAGVYAALLRRYMFDNKKPGVIMAFFIGVVVEVLHLTLIFITNITDPERAFAVVRACTPFMIPANGIAVGLATLLLTLLAREPIRHGTSDRELSQTVQMGMLVAVLLAFAVTTGFTMSLQENLSVSQVSSLLTLNIDDIESDIATASDDNMLRIARRVAASIGSIDRGRGQDMGLIAHEYGVTEVNIVDSQGIVVASSNPDFVGFDMSTSKQSAEFLELLTASATNIVQSYQPIAYDDTIWRKYAGVTIRDGFVQVGYDAQAFQADLESQVHGMTDSRHVGKTGTVIVADAAGNVMSSRSALDSNSLEALGLGSVTDSYEPDTLFTATFMGVPVYGMYGETEGYRIIAVQPVEEATFARNVAVLVSAFMEIIVFAALFGVIYFLIKRLVVDKIRNIMGTLSEITDGNLDVTVNVRSSEEFASLSDDINRTVGALKKAIADAAARIDAELEYARTIQRSALPAVFPPYPSHKDFQIFASMDAAKEVGGDFYDFYLLDDDHLMFLIADVSGKGIPASLFMMRSKTLIKSLTESGLAPHEVLSHANDELCSNNEAEMFVTCWLGMLDLRTGTVTFGNAGHNPPALARRDGAYALHPVRPNMVLAGIEGIPYRLHELQLEPGDTLFLYTDGVTEATDANDELFGEDRLLASLNARRDESVDELCRGVHADVDAFVGEAPQSDDITVLALRYLGRGGTDDDDAER